MSNCHIDQNEAAATQRVREVRYGGRDRTSFPRASDQGAARVVAERPEAYEAAKKYCSKRVSPPVPTAKTHENRQASARDQRCGSQPAFKNGSASGRSLRH